MVLLCTSHTKSRHTCLRKLRGRDIDPAAKEDWNKNRATRCVQKRNSRFQSLFTPCKHTVAINGKSLLKQARKEFIPKREKVLSTRLCVNLVSCVCASRVQAFILGYIGSYWIFNSCVTFFRSKASSAVTCHSETLTYCLRATFA